MTTAGATSPTSAPEVPGGSSPRAIARAMAAVVSFALPDPAGQVVDADHGLAPLPLVLALRVSAREWTLATPHQSKHHAAA